MLILVGVSVTVALNGGLFRTAKQASDETKAERDNELALSDGTITINGETYTSYDEYVNGKKPSESWVDNGDGTYTKGDTTITVGQTTFTNDEVQQQLGATGGTYTGTWTVVGVKENKVKLISTENVGSRIVGYNDPGAIEAIPLAEGAELTDAVKMERAIWSYKNAVNSLDTETKTLTGINSAKSITVDDLAEIIGLTEEEKEEKASGRTYRFYYSGTGDTAGIYYQYLDKGEQDTDAADTTAEGWSEAQQLSGYNSFRSYDYETGKEGIIDSTAANKNNVVKIKDVYYHNIALSAEQKTTFSFLVPMSPSTAYILNTPYITFSSYYTLFKFSKTFANMEQDVNFFYNGGAPGTETVNLRAVVYI